MRNKKVKIVSITVTLALMLTIVIGLGQEKILAAETRVIIDLEGKSIEIPKEIKRIVTGPCPFPSMVYAVDGTGKRIVGMKACSMIHVETSILGRLAPELKNASTAFAPKGWEIANVEELLKLKPDVYLGFSGNYSEREMVENAGIPYVALKYGTQEGLEDGIKLLGELLGKEDRAKKILAYMHNTVNYISSITKNISREGRPRVITFYNVAQLRTVGQGTYNQMRFELTGGVNVAEDTISFSNVDMEQVLAWNPDIIYISNFAYGEYPEDILQNKIEGQDWNQINAVKNGKVYKIPMGEYRWAPPCCESALMFKWMAQKHHPDLFSYSMVEELKEYYSKFYNYDLSDEETEKILYPRLGTNWEE